MKRLVLIISFLFWFLMCNYNYAIYFIRMVFAKDCLCDLVKCINDKQHYCESIRYYYAITIVEAITAGLWEHQNNVAAV
jgi:hypothetical protein